MPIDTGCSYHLSNLYDLKNSNWFSAKEALVRFGMLGPAENYTWNITITCQGLSDINVTSYSVCSLVINM